jgi:hypothetical protein
LELECTVFCCGRGINWAANIARKSEKVTCLLQKVLELVVNTVRRWRFPVIHSILCSLQTIEHAYSLDSRRPKFATPASFTPETASQLSILHLSQDLVAEGEPCSEIRLAQVILESGLPFSPELSVHWHLLYLSGIYATQHYSQFKYYLGGG